MIRAFLQKSAPDNADFIVFLLFLLFFLTILLLFNRLADWLRSKPWKRDIPPEDGEPGIGKSAPTLENPAQDNLEEIHRIDKSMILGQT